MPRLRLGRSSRLKRQGDFQNARARGQRVVNGCLIANVLPRSQGEESRIGVITSRAIGPAVGRARARRLLRESYRLHQFELNQPVDLILVARRSIAGKSFADVERDLLRALKQLRILKDPQ